MNVPTLVTDTVSGHVIDISPLFEMNHNLCQLQISETWLPIDKAIELLSVYLEDTAPKDEAKDCIAQLFNVRNAFREIKTHKEM